MEMSLSERIVLILVYVSSLGLSCLMISVGLINSDPQPLLAGLAMFLSGSFFLGLNVRRLKKRS